MLTSKTKHEERRRDESFQPNPTFSTQRKSSVIARGCVLNFAYRLVNSILNLLIGRPIFSFWRGRGNSILAGQEILMTLRLVYASYSMLCLHPAPFLIIILLLGCVSSYHLFAICCLIKMIIHKENTKEIDV